MRTRPILFVASIPSILTVALVTSAHADLPAPPLALREAVALAARNNPVLAAALADVAIADAQGVGAAGLDDSIRDASGAWVRSRREVLDGTPVQQPRADDLVLSTALTRPLPTGGRLGLRLSTELNRTEYLSDVGASGGPERAVAEARLPSLQLFSSHPLLRGAGVAVARAPRRRAQVARDVAVLERDAAAAAVARDVVLAYWDAALAQQELEIHRSASASARQQLAAVEAGIEVGKLPRSASAEVLVAVALREDDTIAAENALRIRSIELARLIGLPLDPQRVGFGLQAPGEQLAAVPSAEPTLERALAQNPQLAAVRTRTNAAAIEVDVAANGLLPTLDVALSAATQGNARDSETAFRQLRSGRSYEVQAGLVFQLPLGRHAALGAMGVARGELHKARLTEADITAQIRAAVLDRTGTLEAAGRRLRALAETTAAASLDLAAEKARFEVGRATNFDVLRRQDELADAQLHVLHARIDQLRASAGLEALTGTIVQRYATEARQ